MMMSTVAMVPFRLLGGGEDPATRFVADRATLAARHYQARVARPQVRGHQVELAFVAHA